VPVDLRNLDLLEKVEDEAAVRIEKVRPSATG
jgi:hypothetical protein